MSSEFSSFNRQPGKAEIGRAPAARGGSSLYVIFGGAVLLAAMIGGGIVYFLTSPGAPQQAAASNAPAANAPAARPAAGGNQAAAPAGPVQWTNTGTFGSWQVRCQTGSGAPKICTAVLEVIDSKNKQVLMAWVIGPDQKGGMQTVLQTPSGVLVGNGIDMKLTNAPVRHINYLSCLPQQCTAVTPMDEAFLKETLAAPKADITVYAANGKSLAFGIPVTGIDKALAAIKK